MEIYVRFVLHSRLQETMGFMVLLPVNHLRSATYLFAGLCRIMWRVVSGEGITLPFMYPSSLSPSKPITPQDTKGDSPFCLFLSTLCFIPSSLVSHHLLLTPLLRKRMQRRPSIISIMGKWGGLWGLLSPLQPHVTLFWLSLPIRHHHLSFM